MEQEELKPVKIAMITGYLGAGKTTLLNHILTNNQGIRAAVIVNDIGEVNIDADLIAQTGAVTQMDDSLIPMTNGCICCSLSEDLAAQLVSLATSGNYDYIIIEASGICEPLPIAYTISQFCDVASGRVEVAPPEEGDEELEPLPPISMDLDNVIAVVDAARMFDEFNGGQDLLDDDLEEDDVENLIINQIEFCSTLVLNKADQVTPDQMGELRVLVRSLQKDAVIIEATQGQVPLEEMLNTGRFDFEKVYDSATWVSLVEGTEEPEDEHEHEHHDHDEDEECDDPDCECHHHHDDDDDDDHDHEGHEHHHGHHCHHHHDHDHDHVLEYGISTFVYERVAPINVEALRGLVKRWPESIIRCKGMIWAAEDNDMCYVFEQAGKRFYLSQNGLWLATAEPDELAAIVAQNPQVMKDWDPEVGDRRVKLVFIGKNMDQADIERQMDACLA